VDFTYEAAGMQVGPFKLLHVPGHCAGHVVIRLHDVLFSGDHVLQRTSPPLESLRQWAGGVRLTLAGHEAPIRDLPARLDEIREVHAGRLQKVLELLVEPLTIAEVSRDLFGEVHGYNVLLALEESGAHVEYLYQRGVLGIDNLSEFESGNGPVPVRYRRLQGGLYQQSTL
jgi:hypothetical protein